MEKKSLAFVLGVVVVLTGLMALQNHLQPLYIQQSSNLTLDPPQTVPYVDLDQYFGLWYQIALIPQIWQRGCTDGQVRYSRNTTDGNVRIDNLCHKHGETKDVVGKGIPLDKTNSKLKVQFVKNLKFGGHYYVVRLAKDYSYSVVSTPDYKYLWILYRQPVMPDALYNQLYQSLKKDGFHVEQLVKQPRR